MKRQEEGGGEAVKCKPGPCVWKNNSMLFHTLCFLY